MSAPGPAVGRAPHRGGCHGSVGLRRGKESLVPASEGAAVQPHNLGDKVTL